MSNSGFFCGLKPLLFGRKTSKFEILRNAYQSKSQKKKLQGSKMERSPSRGSGDFERSRSRGSGNFLLMMELRKKIFTLRDIIDLPPCDGAPSINELVMATMKDLHKFYPEIITSSLLSEIKEASIDKVLAYFCAALKSIGDSWMMNQEWMDKTTYNMYNNDQEINSEQVVEIALATLDCLIKIPKDFFDMMDEDETHKDSQQSNAFSKILSGSYSDNISNSPCSVSPMTPTSVLPEFLGSPPSGEFGNFYCSSPLLRSLRVQALGKLNPIDVKRLSFHMPSNARTQECSNLNQKDYVDDETMAEEEAKNKLLYQRSNSDEELMFEMEASSDSEETKAADLEDPRDNSPKNGSPKTAAAETTTVTTEFTELLEQNHILSNVESVPPPHPPMSSSMTVEIAEMPSPSPTLPPTPSTSQLNGLVPVPPLPPVTLQQSAATPQPPPPPALLPSVLQPHLVSSIPPSPPAMLQQNLTAVNAPLLLPQLPPPPPPPPMISKSITAASPPPPPPPPPAPSMKPRNVTTPPPPLPPMSSGSRIAAPMPPPPPPSQASNARTAPPPPPPSPPMKPRNVITPPPPLPPMSLGSRIPAPMPQPPPPPTPPQASTARTAPPPPPPPMMSSKGSMPLPPAPPMPLANGAAPPPPPPGAARSLRPNKAQTKLKRSSQMGNLYRTLKGKVEGGNQNAKSSNGRKAPASNSSGGKQGMADALAEMTKRSAYFQQIEGDVQKYEKSITELKPVISTFQTKDMTELMKFHKHVESILEKLTDETQVLARFEGFPQKKLEALRTAAALYSKLNGTLCELQNWKVEAPLGQLLDKTERYFNKIKGELDALERTKDEESKKFQGHNIHFDFHILVQVKESMVDVSSNCMELALKERRQAKLAAETAVTGTRPDPRKCCAKMLWRAFQFAFRVYTFAGGHDDRADQLTRELAHEIQTDPQHQ